MVLLPLLATGLACSVLLTTSVYVQIVVLVALIGVAGTLIGAVSDWLRHRKFYRGLERCAEHLESVSWAMEMMEYPEDADDCVKLVVRDNGRGVPAADLGRVFDRGFTGENGRNGKRSTGIGLYLVKRLCDKMGLGIVARSEHGEFFEVEITFPTNHMHYFES